MAKVTKKCKDCTHLSKVVIDNFAICKLIHTDIWIDSVACEFYDDTPVF